MPPKKRHQHRQEASLIKCSAINHGLAAKLIQKGYPTLAHLGRATDEELLAVPGINEAKLAAIRVRGGA